MLKILFLDSKSSIARLVDLDMLEKKASVTYSGERYYGCKDEALKCFDLIVQSHFPNLVHQSMILLCKKLNIPTAFIFDGVFDWANTYNNPKHTSLGIYIGRPFLHDIVFYVSSGDSLKYLKYKNPGVKFINYMPFRNRKCNVSVGINDLKKDTVLITTANTAYFDDKEFSSLVDLIKDTIHVCEELGIKVIYRIFDRKILKSLNIDKDNYIDCNLSDVLNISTIVLSTPSTLNVDVVGYNLPLGSLIYRNSPVLNNGGWVIYDKKTARDSILQMLNGHKDIDFIERINFQRSLIACDKENFENLSKKDLYVCLNKSDVSDILDDITAFTTFSYVKIFISQLIFYIKKLIK